MEFDERLTDSGHIRDNEGNSSDLDDPRVPYHMLLDLFPKRLIKKIHQSKETPVSVDLITVYSGTTAEKYRARVKHLQEVHGIDVNTFPTDRLIPAFKKAKATVARIDQKRPPQPCPYRCYREALRRIGTCWMSLTWRLSDRRLSLQRQTGKSDEELISLLELRASDLFEFSSHPLDIWEVHEALSLVGTVHDVLFPDHPVSPKEQHL